MGHFWEGTCDNSLSWLVEVDPSYIMKVHTNNSQGEDRQQHTDMLEVTMSLFEDKNKWKHCCLDEICFIWRVSFVETYYVKIKDI